MKRGTARLFLLFLVAFTVLTWSTVVGNKSKTRAAYEEYLSQGEFLEEQEIYVDALENYQNALKLDPGNYVLTMKVADMYYMLGNYHGFITECDNAISLNPENPEPYVKKAEYYIMKSQYNEAIKVVRKAEKATDDENVVRLGKELSYKFNEKYVGLKGIQDWHVKGKNNYVAAMSNDKWGMTEKDGSRKVAFSFEYIGAYDEESGVIPCCLDGIYYYIDEAGNKKLAAKNKYQFLGSFGAGYAPAQRDNKYGYIDKKFNEQYFEFEYAGAFANNVAAVKKDGKWALINDKFKNITPFEYDDILVDSYGYCAMFDIIVVCKDGRYSFIDHKGNKVGDLTFDNARMPASNDSYIAVKQGEVWGFANQKGEIVISPQYSGAKSFSLGLAPVQVDDKWGYINTDGKLVIENQYKDAKVFSQEGSAAVYNGYAWNIIVLCEYDD